MKKRERKIKEKKTIALVAHDNMKDDLIGWVVVNREKLIPHRLIGTGTTATLVSEYTGLEVEGCYSGPLGGDQQIGAKISLSEIDMLIFFWDPLESQPHDPDVKALLRLATLYNIATATSPITADYLVSSPMFNGEYIAVIPDNKSNIKSRASSIESRERSITKNPKLQEENN